MSNTPLDEFAWRHGIAPTYSGYDGTRDITEETKRTILAGFGMPVETEAEIQAALEAMGLREPPVMQAAPGRACFLPEWLKRDRAWGISLQLYELRSDRNWGIGDFADLQALVPVAAEAGADFLGVSPLHALFLSRPSRCSPFFPSNRRFLNPLYIAVDRAPGYAEDAGERIEIDRLRSLDTVDYAGVTRIKLAALRRAYRNWRETDDSAASTAPDFEAFRTLGGHALRNHALFDALSQWRTSLGEGSGWTAWPDDYRDLGSAAVTDFAAAHDDGISFYAWLQWVAAMQLAETQAAARASGMRIGLYLDLAVGEAPDGSASWSDRSAYVQTVSFGAPPDMFTADGQDWGLTPLSPVALAQDACARFRHLMQASMRSTGALRIDHVMALWQLFFVPKDGRPSDGAYVHYPIERLLETLADISAEHGTIVIGEDLGNVPVGFREVMQASAILSYRILYFEQNWGQSFISPDAYPHLAIACLSTHDLPTISGWWAGVDIGLRLEHALIDLAAAEGQRADRREERWRVVRALADAGCLTYTDLTQAQAEGREVPEGLVVAAHRFIARTRSMLAGVRLADLVGEDRQTNVPGTIDSYPNWRLKLTVPIEDIAASALFRSITAAVAAERPKQA